MKLVKIMAVIACFAIAVWIAFLSQKNGLPQVEKGRSVVIYDAEHYAETHTVYAVDATRETVFLNHGRVISGFDWNGDYCFSIVTLLGKGKTEIYCSGEELTLCDVNNHVFVYEGAQLLRDYQLETRDQYSQFRKEQLTKKNELVSLSGKDVVDRDGRIILTVHDVPPVLSPAGRWIVITAFFLVFSLFIGFVVFRKH